MVASGRKDRHHRGVLTYALGGEATGIDAARSGARGTLATGMPRGSKQSLRAAARRSSTRCEHTSNTH
jgi:hypothetical protein